MRRFKDKFKDFRAKPTTFAQAGKLFIAPKFLLSAIIALSACWYIESKDLLLSIAVLTYPVVGLTIDVFLYGFRKQIWPNLPNAALIPSHWKITPLELQRYAQCLPKVRFMRMWVAAIATPFFAEALTLKKLSITFGCTFFLLALFDRYWLKRLKLQAPKLSKRQYKKRSRPSRWIDDEYERMNAFKQTDPTIPGTPAWVGKQNVDSMGARSDSWLNDRSHLPMPINPSPFSSNTWPPN
ncbi:MAG: hypothetical protein KA508_07295 [Gammaproteobacteria bacterium]|nr:hypothetical protein [Gammaproteobacteria bacterium]